MTQAGKANLTQGVFFAAIARQFFEAAARESIQYEKVVMNSYAGKCKAIEDHILTYSKGSKAVEHFRQEIKRGDTLQLGNIVEVYLSMNTVERDVFERMTEAIKRGEAIEYVNQEAA
jgi:hypothetical protein